MAAGDFTATRLQKIQLKAEKIWSDSANAKSKVPHAEAAQAVLAHQTARFQEMSLVGKDNSVLISWVNTCDDGVDACEPNCVLDEPELFTEATEKQYDICFGKGFSIDEEKLRGDIYTQDELIAEGLAAKLKTMDEEWARRILVKLKAFAGVNQSPFPFNFDAAKNTTVVPDNLYFELGKSNGFQLPTLFLQQAMLNRIENPYYIDSGLLYVDYLNAQLNAGNTDINGAGASARAGLLDITFDQWNFAKAGITNANTFMIDRNAIAFRTRNRHTDVPRTLRDSGQVRYTVASPSLPGVVYDAYFQEVCKTINGKDHIVNTWHFETNGGIWLNPEGCPVTLPAGNGVAAGTYKSTGVLSYTAAGQIV